VGHLQPFIASHCINVNEIWKEHLSKYAWICAIRQVYDHIYVWKQVWHEYTHMNFHLTFRFDRSKIKVVVGDNRGFDNFRILTEAKLLLILCRIYMYVPTSLSCNLSFACTCTDDHICYSLFPLSKALTSDSVWTSFVIFHTWIILPVKNGHVSYRCQTDQRRSAISLQ
jgi:hypothetical protein